MAPFFVHLISPNISRFSNFFTVRISRQFVIKLSQARGSAALR